jgi:hypothetical protein
MVDLTCSPFVIPGAIARSIVRIESGGAIASLIPQASVRSGEGSYLPCGDDAIGIID